MKRNVKLSLKEVIRLVLKLLCLLGCAWFLLPIFRKGVSIGVALGEFICILGLCILQFYGRLALSGGWKKAVARLVTSLYCVGLCWTLFLTAMIASAWSAETPQGCNVIVLGSQVFSAEKLGIALTGRVNAAAQYLKDNPEAKVIVTGGQGDDEPCSEALAEKNALIKLGIAEDRIYVEDSSESTKENLEFSREIAEEEGLGESFVIATQGFHMYRALSLAESAGFTAYPLTADTDLLLLPEYFGRELLSLTKFYAQEIFLKG